MTEIINYEGYSIRVRRKAYQKRLGISVHPSGEIRVSANKSLPEREIIKFLKSNHSWLEESVQSSQSLRDRYPKKEFRTGESFPYLGAQYELKILKGERLNLRFVDHQIHFTSTVAEADLTDNQRLKYFRAFLKSYRQVAESIMGQRLYYHAQRMNLHPSGVQFRDQKSIWGSCSPENKISLNFKLIVAPIRVVDYVLIHELAHIRHKDHSHRFWTLVERFTDHREYSREWLRENLYEGDFLAKKSELHLDQSS